MNDPLYNRLRETSWKRKLTAAEAAELREWLAAHPEAGAEWELEAHLNRTLEVLPDAPVPGNFTARVVQTVERETAEPLRSARITWFWRSLLPRASVALLLLILCVFVYERHQSAQRAELAQQLSNVAAISDPELFADFETIQRLSQTGMPDRDLTPDEDLIALLQ